MTKLAVPVLICYVVGCLVHILTKWGAWFAEKPENKFWSWWRMFGYKTGMGLIGDGVIIALAYAGALVPLGKTLMAFASKAPEMVGIEIPWAEFSVAMDRIAVSVPLQSLLALGGGYIADSVSKTLLGTVERILKGVFGAATSIWKKNGDDD